MMLWNDFFVNKLLKKKKNLLIRNPLYIVVSSTDDLWGSLFNSLWIRSMINKRGQLEIEVRGSKSRG